MRQVSATYMYNSGCYNMGLEYANIESVVKYKQIFEHCRRL